MKLPAISLACLSLCRSTALRSLARPTLAIGLIIAAAVQQPPRHLWAQQPARLAVTPTIRIDGEKATLMPVRQMAIGPDGAIAVMQQMVRKVRLFDARGAAIADLGRAGEGPGEFRSVSRIGWHADTLWVIDSQLDRVTLFSRTGELIRTEPTPGRAHPLGADVGRFPEFRSAKASARVPDGSFVSYVGLETGGREGPHWGRTLTTYMHIAADGSILNLIASVPDYVNHDSYGYYHTFADGSFKGRPFPFSAPPRLDISPDGLRSVVTEIGGRTPADAFVRMTMVATDGDTLFSRAYLVPAFALLRSVADSAIAAAMSRIREVGAFRPASWNDAALRTAAAAWQERAEKYILPYYPPVRHNAETVIGRDGSVWIPLRETSEGSPYLVLDAAGRAMGHPVFPAGVRIGAADATVAWGVQLDEYDVPSLVRYRLSVQER